MVDLDQNDVAKDENDQSQVIQTGLTYLQQKHNESIKNFNTAYVVVLVEAYRRTQILSLAAEYDFKFETNPLTHAINKCLDFEIQDHIERVIQALAKLPAANDLTEEKHTYYTRTTNHSKKSIIDDVTVELIGMPLSEV